MKKILIANRGEIAIRIARSCQDLGIKTVGIFSQDDSKSLHLSKVDEAYEVEGKGASAYLNIKEIISIAKEAKVDAVHPGYGFLSENPKFVSALKRSKIKFMSWVPGTPLVSNRGCFFFDNKILSFLVL